MVHLVARLINTLLSKADDMYSFHVLGLVLCLQIPVMRVVIFEGTTRRGMNLKDNSSNMKMLKKGEMLVMCDVVQMQQSFLPRCM